VPEGKLVEVPITERGAPARVADSFGTVFFVDVKNSHISVRREVGLDRPYLRLVDAHADSRQLRVNGGAAWGGRSLPAENTAVGLSGKRHQYRAELLLAKDCHDTVHRQSERSYRDCSIIHSYLEMLMR
jgi:hypothetical protein